MFAGGRRGRVGRGWRGGGDFLCCCWRFLDLSHFTEVCRLQPVNKCPRGGLAGRADRYGFPARWDFPHRPRNRLKKKKRIWHCSCCGTTRPARRRPRAHGPCRCLVIVGAPRRRAPSWVLLGESSERRSSPGSGPGAVQMPVISPNFLVFGAHRGARIRGGPAPASAHKIVASEAPPPGPCPVSISPPVPPGWGETPACASVALVLARHQPPIAGAQRQTRPCLRFPPLTTSAARRRPRTRPRDHRTKAMFRRPPPRKPDPSPGFGRLRGALDPGMAALPRYSRRPPPPSIFGAFDGARVFVDTWAGPASLFSPRGPRSSASEMSTGVGPAGTSTGFSGMELVKPPARAALKRRVRSLLAQSTRAFRPVFPFRAPLTDLANKHEPRPISSRTDRDLIWEQLDERRGRPGHRLHAVTRSRNYPWSGHLQPFSLDEAGCGCAVPTPTPRPLKVSAPPQPWGPKGALLSARKTCIINAIQEGPLASSTTRSLRPLDP